MDTTVLVRNSVATSVRRAPLVGVVRTPSREEAAVQARTLAACGVDLVEITFTVPGATGLVRELLAERRGTRGGHEADGPPWIGMGTVSTAERAREAVAAGAEFFVTPNVNAEVARTAREAGIYLIMGALTPTEIVNAAELGADLVKVYPLPPVGGPAYLSVIRGPLGDIPMLAAGGFGVEEIPLYAQAGAVAFGLAAPLLGVGPAGDDSTEARRRIARALTLARGSKTPEETR